MPMRCWSGWPKRKRTWSPPPGRPWKARPSLASTSSSPDGGRPSEVDGDRSTGTGAAQQHLSRRGVVEGLGLVRHGAVDEARLAAVADARATGPVGGNVARLGQLEQVAIALVPRERQPRAAESDIRALTRWSGRRVGVRGVVARLRAEHLAVETLRSDAPRKKACGQLAEEGRRSAQVEVGLAWDAQPQQCLEVDAPGGVEVDALAVFAPRAAVADVCARRRQPRQMLTRLGGEGVLGAEFGDGGDPVPKTTGYLGASEGVFGASQSRIPAQ